MPSLVETVVKLDVGAQEPWPNDVKLYQPYAMEQILLPDNANCLAVQAFLHMCGLPFQIEHRANAEFMSPSGKVPFIKCGAFVVSELEPIVQFVANKGITLTEELSADQKSDMRAYMSIIYTVLMNAELYICWCDKRTYNEVTKVRNGSVYPWPLNHIQTWSKRSAVNRKLKVLGWYQKSIESVYQEVENCCQALSERLDGKEYFFGSKPTQVDAYLYGHIFAILSSPEYSSELITIIMKFPNLVSHCKRICTNYVNNTSLKFSELLEPTKSASKLILNNNTCTYELKASNQVTEITRYLKYLNSDSDLSELTKSCSRETCKTNSETVKRTSSLTDCSIFDTEQVNNKLLSITNERYQALSKSDHQYLTNLFCADKPPVTEVKFVKLGSKGFSDTSSLSSQGSIKRSESTSWKSSRNISNSSLPRSSFAIQDKDSSKTITPSDYNKEISNTSLSSKKSGILKKKVSKKYLAIVNEKLTDSSLSDEEYRIPEKNISKKSVTFLTENKKVSKTSVFSDISGKPNKKVSKTSFTSDISGKPNKKDSIKSLAIVNETTSNTSLSSEEFEIETKRNSKKSLTFLTENKKVSQTSLSCENSEKPDTKDSKKSLKIVSAKKQSSDTSFSSVESGELENKVSFKSLTSGNEDEKYLDGFVCCEQPGIKASKKSVTVINEDKKSSNISFFAKESGLQKKVSKKSLASFNIDEKYINISISSEESGKTVSKKSLTGETEKQRKNVSLSGDVPVNKVSKRSLTIANEDRKSSNICFSNLESGMPAKKVSRKSLASVDEKYLDISISSEGSGNKVSKKSLTTMSEDKKSSNTSFFGQESGLISKKFSKKSLASLGIDENYLDISLSSEGSGNKVSLTVINENKKNSKKSLGSLDIDEKYLDISLSSKGSANKVSLTVVNGDKKNSKKSFGSLDIDEKYLDISLSSEGSGNIFSKKFPTVATEYKKNSNISLISQQSGNQGQKVSRKSLASLFVDDKYLDISLSSEGSESKISKKSLIANEDKKKSNMSISSQELGNQGKKVSKKSLTSVDLDVSLSSEESGNNVSKRSLVIEDDLDISISSEEYDYKRKIVSQKSLSVVFEDSQISDSSQNSNESDKQQIKDSKKSSNENNDLNHAYSDISLNSF